MTTQTTNLFRVDELEDVQRSDALTENDLNALRSIADWVGSYVVKPHKDLGRAGPVCPFVPGAVERGKLWLAPEHVSDGDTAGVSEILTRYRRLFLNVQPPEAEDASRAAIIVSFTDLTAVRARGLFNEVLQQLAIPSYAEDGIVYGPFYEGHDGRAIYNSDFHPFRSPVPFVFVRYGVVDDWKFFLDNHDMFSLYAHRFGEFAVHALADELRRLPWRVARS